MPEVHLSALTSIDGDDPTAGNKMWWLTYRRDGQVRLISTRLRRIDAPRTISRVASFPEQ
jgi:hypothetical protein